MIDLNVRVKVDKDKWRMNGNMIKRFTYLSGYSELDPCWDGMVDYP